MVGLSTEAAPTRPVILTGPGLSDARPLRVPWRLALVSVLQFIEGLSDRQAADAARGRIDWKYALGLELTDAGFNYSGQFKSLP
jgi:transposase